jgi:iron complex transport system substrate-binding protein
MPSNTEILFAIGAGAQVVGVTSRCDYPAEAREKAKIGDLFSMNMEAVVGLKPDLALATRENPPELIQGLRKLNIPVYVCDPQTVDAVLETIRTFGKLTGQVSQAETTAQVLQKRLSAISAIVTRIPSNRRLSVFVGNPQNTEHWTPGPGTFTTDIIRRVGGRNIAADLKPGSWGVYSLETILAQKPDVILATVESDGEPEAAKQKILTAASGMPGWKDLRAIKNGRVVIARGDLIFRPGPRIVLAMEALIRELYPKLTEELAK